MEKRKKDTENKYAQEEEEEGKKHNLLSTGNLSQHHNK